MPTFVRDTILGEYLLKCRDCGKEQLYVTGANLLYLGDVPDKVSCVLCKRDDVFVVQTPTVISTEPVN